ncbi:MAG: AmmeMemoRadiSam system radical SAM enzyme [bacterium]|nr:AmmeMemoRadiSam system radical SAM enzyme [bacterium]
MSKSEKYSTKLSRRHFLYSLGGLAATSMVESNLAFNLLTAPRGKNLPPRYEARYYKKLAQSAVLCQLCFRQCSIPTGKRGFCRNRENQQGTLYTLVYNRPCAIQIDPIEKEPAFHMLPGSTILCIGTAGCNFRCQFCHNWHMSMFTVEETDTYEITPEEIAERATRKGCRTLSFTYNEPTVFYEFMFDIVQAGRKRGLRALVHTNGAMAEEPLKDLLKYMDAVTVDFKSINPSFYRNLPENADITPVLRNLKLIRQLKKQLELVNLVIPTWNDNMQDVEKMCSWVKENLGTDVPIHFNRFSPAYKLKNVPHTPVTTLETIYAVAKKHGLQYVYIGNVPGHKNNSTYCPKCKKLLLGRYHFSVLENNLKDGKCKFCGYPISGIWT